VAPDGPIGPTTFHLVAKDAWDDADPGVPYVAGSLAVEGFVHCTDGVTEMIATANRHYRDDARRFLVLTIDLGRVGSPWRYDVPGSPYPHVYGPIERAGILRVIAMPRDAAGRFLRFDP
jgi:uncharacterized protein (DUF952 family)